MNFFKKLCPEGYEHFEKCCFESSLPSKTWSALHFINFLSPLIFVLCGFEWTNLSPNIIGTIFIYLLSDSKNKNVRSFFKFSIQDTVLFWTASVIFGQPLLPESFLEVLYWAAWAGTSSNIFGRKLGVSANAFGVIILSPILTLDWMAWWQRWPIPGILGLSIGQIFAMMSVSLFIASTKNQ